MPTVAAEVVVSNVAPAGYVQRQRVAAAPYSALLGRVGSWIGAPQSSAATGTTGSVTVRNLTGHRHAGSCKK